MHTSIKSLFAPSEMAACPSYWSGSKSFKAAVRYSPAGVLLTNSEPVLTRATVPSFLSVAKGEGRTSTERELVLLPLPFLYQANQNMVNNHMLVNKTKITRNRIKSYLPVLRG